MTSTTNAVDNVTLFAQTRGASGYTNTTTRRTNSSSGPTRVEAYDRGGALKKITGGLTHPVRYEYGPSNSGTFTKEIKLNASGADTSEWTKLNCARQPMQRVCLQKIIRRWNSFSATNIYKSSPTSN